MGITPSFISYIVYTYKINKIFAYISTVSLESIVLINHYYNYTASTKYRNELNCACLNLVKMSLMYN